MVTALVCSFFLVTAGEFSNLKFRSAAEHVAWLEENERGEELDEGLPSGKSTTLGAALTNRPSWVKQMEKRRRQFWRSMPKPQKAQPPKKPAKEYFDPDE